MNERAGQFMPFATLKGYYDLTDEAEREKTVRIELCEDAAEELSKKLSQLRRGMLIKVKYYHIDSYVTHTDIIFDIDFVFRRLSVGTDRISFDDISDIELIN